MSDRSLQARLNTLSNSLRLIQQLINRLSKHSSEPGTRLSDEPEGDVRTELTTEIHQNLKEQEEKFELLLQEVEDQATPSRWQSTVQTSPNGGDGVSIELATKITRLGEDLKL